MAKRKPIVIDGDVTNINPKATLADLVEPTVHSIVTHDGRVISKEQFRRVPVPEGFETNLSPINKGAPLSKQAARLDTTEAIEHNAKINLNGHQRG